MNNKRDIPTESVGQKQGKAKEEKAVRQAKKREKKAQKKEFEKWLKSKEEPSIVIDKQERALYATDKEPRKALSTFFRNQNKMMVTTMALADRKAMIMIQINSLIVSAAMIFYTYIDEGLYLGWLIAVVLIFGTGMSLLFSILAARPNGRYLQKVFQTEIIPKYPNLEDHNFWINGDVTLDEYEQSMDKVVNSQELQIGNQVRFAYQVEKYLSSKYKLLDIAYNFFLGSLMLTAILFVINRILGAW